MTGKIPPNCQEKAECLLIPEAGEAKAAALVQAVALALGSPPGHRLQVHHL